MGINDADPSDLISLYPVFPQYQMIVVGHYCIDTDADGKDRCQFAQAIRYPSLAVFVIVAG